MSVTSAPASVAPSMNAAISGSDDGRMSWPTISCWAPVKCANAFPMRRASASSISSGYDAADVVGLEDGVERHEDSCEGDRPLDCGAAKFGHSW